MASSRILALFVVAVIGPVAMGQDAASFAGKWSGRWTNSLGGNGESKLELAEGRDGKVTGTWDGIEVTGKRVNTNTVELQGRTKEASYQMTATISKGELTLRYLAAGLGEKDGSYDGKGTLSRDK